MTEWDKLTRETARAREARLAQACAIGWTISV